jgi:hypothetical protein
VEKQQIKQLECAPQIASGNGIPELKHRSHV